MENWWDLWFPRRVTVVPWIRTEWMMQTIIYPDFFHSCLIIKCDYLFLVFSTQIARFLLHFLYINSSWRTLPGSHVALSWYVLWLSVRKNGWVEFAGRLLQQELAWKGLELSSWFTLGPVVIIIVYHPYSLCYIVSSPVLLLIPVLTCLNKIQPTSDITHVCVWPIVDSPVRDNKICILKLHYSRHLYKKGEQENIIHAVLHLNLPLSQAAIRRAWGS